MTKLKFLIVVILMMVSTTSVFASVSLNVKIGQMINNQFIEINKTLSVDFNKEVIIQDDSFKDKIVLTLRKIKNVLANGVKIEPVQINVRMIGNDKKETSSSQTITSFYTNEASFKIASNQRLKNALAINLNFSEVN